MIGEKINEAYTWQAIYDLKPILNLQEVKGKVVYAGDLSGEIIADLWEIDDQGIQRATYATIDRGQLKCFNVYKTVEAIASLQRKAIFKPFLTIEIKPGCRLIWRKRRRQRTFATGGVFLTLYMAGWQETKVREGLIEGINFQAINYIYHFTMHGFDTQNDVVVLSGGGKSDVELLDFEIPTL